MEIVSRNTNTLTTEIVSLLQDCGMLETSRNGPVLRFPEPVTICLTHPWERVNFSAVRDANPFFHLIEALAMLGNHNDAKFLSHFAKNILAFSDDGARFNAFYGTRLREYRTKQQTQPMDAMVWPINQLDGVIQVLRRDPMSRQAVATLWDPSDLLYDRTRDKACNLMLVFSNDNGRLRMSSYNRSNDAIWGGVMGANIVHLSLFQEYVACALGLPMGCWWHHSNNLHVYTETNGFEKWNALKTAPAVPNLYASWSLDECWYALFNTPTDKLIFDRALNGFLSDAVELVREGKLGLLVNRTYSAAFLNRVAVPMFNAWQLRKQGRHSDALELCGQIGPADWRVATQEWIKRRLLPTT